MYSNVLIKTVWLLLATWQIVNNPCNAIKLTGRDDFLLLLGKTNASRLQLSTMQIEPLPIATPANFFSAEFDAHRNCIIWADRTAKQFKRQCFNGDNTVEVLLSLPDVRVGRITYDWFDQVIYYLNSDTFRIEKFKLNDKKRAVETVVQLATGQLPKGIAVHPKRDYLFWTCTNEKIPTAPVIMRSDLFGDDQRLLVREPIVSFPDVISIDFATDRLYWSDIDKIHIASCDFDGNNHRIIVPRPTKIARPFPLAVHGDQLYWGDSIRDTLSHIKINEWDDATGEMDFLLKRYEQGGGANSFWTWDQKMSLYDIKLVSKVIQSQGLDIDPKRKANV